jgi:hypothetical protein
VSLFVLLSSLNSPSFIAVCAIDMLGIVQRNPRACSAYNSFEGYSTLVVGSVSSFIDLMLTNRDKMAADPALSLVPEARAPPNGCCPTTAPVLIVSQRADYNLHMGHLPVLLQLI